MSALETIAHRYPFIPPVLLLATVALLFYWVQPAAAASFPVAAAPIGIIMLYNYWKYRRGSRKPLLRMAYISAILTITLLTLAALNFLFNR